MVLKISGEPFKLFSQENLSETDITINAPSYFIYDATPKTFTATSSKATNLLISYVGRGETTYLNEVAPTNVGQYTVMVSSGDPNFIGTKIQNFEILPKELILEPDSFSKNYGDQDPEFTYGLYGKIWSDSVDVEITRGSGDENGVVSIMYEIQNLSSNYSLGTRSKISFGTLSIQGAPITLAPPENLIYSKSPKQFSASGGNTNMLQIRYSGSGPTVHSNSSNAPVRAGTYQVTASRYASLGNLGIEMVNIGDPGNAADTNGFGSVNYEYQISKNEITLGQYSAFLNSASRNGFFSQWFVRTDLYDESLATAVAQKSTNVALGKAVTAANTYEFNTTNFGPERMVNGNIEDFWLGKGSDEADYLMPCWILIDLANSLVVDSVLIRNTTNSYYNDRGSKDFSVETSQDGINFVSQISGTLAWQSTSFQAFQFSAPVAARYVRIVITSAYGPYSGPGLSEVKVNSVAIAEKTYGINRSGTLGDYVFTVVGDPNLAVTGIGLQKQRMFCNWLQNGQLAEPTLFDGAYLIRRSWRHVTEMAEVRPSAVFRLPTKDEIYKASYFKGNSTSAGYWQERSSQNITTNNAGFRIVSIARSQTNQTFAILPKQLDPTPQIDTVRSLYNGSKAVQTLQTVESPIEGVFSGDVVALQTPYVNGVRTGWSGVFDSAGPSTGQADIWATITGLSLTGTDSGNYSLPVSIRKLGTIMPSFLSWSESMGLTGANAAKDADPDGDGITNAAEFVFAGDPHSAGENLIIPEATPQGFKLRWLTRNSGGYGYSVMAKTNLISPWQQVWADPSWTHTTVLHPTRSDVSIHEVIVPWDSPYRFFKIEAQILDIDDPAQG